MSRLFCLLTLVISGTAMAEPPSDDYLIPSRDTSLVARTSLLPQPHVGYMTAILSVVPLSAPRALVIREKSGREATLELRETRRGAPVGSQGFDTASSAIPMDLAVAVKDAVSKMVKDARKPEHEPIRKREEAELHFIAFGPGEASSAWTLNPSPTSRPGKLAELTRILFALSRKSDQDLAEKARRIALDLGRS